MINRATTGININNLQKNQIPSIQEILYQSIPKKSEISCLKQQFCLNFKAKQKEFAELSLPYSQASDSDNLQSLNTDLSIIGSYIETQEFKDSILATKDFLYSLLLMKLDIEKLKIVNKANQDKFERLESMMQLPKGFLGSDKNVLKVLKPKDGLNARRFVKIFCEKSINHIGFQHQVPPLSLEDLKLDFRLKLLSSEETERYNSFNNQFLTRDTTHIEQKSILTQIQTEIKELGNEEAHNEIGTCGEQLSFEDYEVSIKNLYSGKNPLMQKHALFLFELMKKYLISIGIDDNNLKL